MFVIHTYKIGITKRIEREQKRSMWRKMAKNFPKLVAYTKYVSMKSNTDPQKTKQNDHTHTFKSHNKTAINKRQTWSTKSKQKKRNSMYRERKVSIIVDFSSETSKPEDKGKTSEEY
jgi:hypothetical protein